MWSVVSQKWKEEKRSEAGKKQYRGTQGDNHFKLCESSKQLLREERKWKSIGFHQQKR